MNFIEKNFAQLIDLVLEKTFLDEQIAEHRAHDQLPHTFDPQVHDPPPVELVHRQVAGVVEGKQEQQRPERPTAKSAHEGPHILSRVGQVAELPENFRETHAPLRLGVRHAHGSGVWPPPTHWANHRRSQTTLQRSPQGLSGPDAASCRHDHDY